MRRIRILLALWLFPASAHASLALATGISSVTAQSREGGYGCAVIDAANSFVAFGSSNPIVVGVSTFSYISQIQISTFAYTGPLGNSNLITNYRAAAFDSTKGFSYWAATSGTITAIQKIQLAPPPISISSTTTSKEVLLV